MWINRLPCKPKGLRFDPGLYQSVERDFKPLPHLCMTKAVGWMLNTNTTAKIGIKHDAGRSRRRCSKLREKPEV